MGSNFDRALMTTRWAGEVDSSAVWPEYPRPQMTRTQWLNLNGLWDYAIRPQAESSVEHYEGEILVPFAVESALSGVQRPLQPDERLWYRRTFHVPAAWHDQRVLLHFGAVDWETQVWVNGQWVGRHQGGYVPFSFDITAAIRGGADNEITVAVWDPTDRGHQERGKQSLKPEVIWYTAVSGIWQTVWLEPVPSDYIQGITTTPDIDAESLTVQVNAGGENPSGHVRLTARTGGKPVAWAEGQAGDSIHLPVPNPHLWTPETPFLYDLEVELIRDGQTIDTVRSYFGMRKFSVAPDPAGQLRLCLNNQPVFQYGPLDQGYWPDGLYTPPNETAMLYDLQVIKRLGFNMLRKHVKVEMARFYYHCDRMGLIVWQDMPNGGRQQEGRRFARNGRWSVASRANYRLELQAMVDALYNFPCIGLWVPFNEAWGQFEARATADWLRAYDPTRPVDHASGWTDEGGGDFKSLHIYCRELPPTPPEPQRAMILSEFGGYNWQCEDHLWNPLARFGYRDFASPEELTAAYVTLLDEQVAPWIRAGLSAAVYTQTTDVEIETNGFLTYDREVLKMDAEALAAAHCRLYAAASQHVFS